MASRSTSPARSSGTEAHPQRALPAALRRGGRDRRGRHGRAAPRPSLPFASCLMRRHVVRGVPYHRRMAKVIVQHVCSECGTATGRWLGKCPGCGAFGSLVEEMTGQATPAKGSARRRARRPSGSPTSASRKPPRIGTGVPELDRVLGGGLVPASLVLVGGEPGVGKSTLLLAALGNVARGGRRSLLVTGEESVAQVKLRADRLGGAEQVEILAETELESVCATLERERPDVCVIDSIQTLYSADLGSAPGSVGAGARGGRAASARRQGAGCGDDPRRPRDEGRLGRRAARPRAPRRLRPPVRR